MPSAVQDLEEVCSELQELTIRRQQLSDRLNLLSMLKDFRNNAGFREEGGSRHNDECEQIEEELGRLSERKRELQARKDSMERSGVRFAGPASVSPPSDGSAAPAANGICFVDKPPSFPAPQVILDLSKLPPKPSQTLCPHCQQYVTTEICAVVGNTTWMVCMMCTFICCIAGCCLIPFCISSFKDIVHKCPKCRSRIHTCKKL
ncbi:cell death-inducing p53-target protein 1-like [Astyanax mexicanus]|uniref:cell death-inducing p53-target protein 1-like n=1 Tax=Astyanax mexicanus TaxID=7994 RepID=UPI000BBDBA7C|nr:cell death-inducing p53-target protein 1-like [Astyanax mexicanus]